jgi:hypothetical protein
MTPTFGTSSFKDERQHKMKEKNLMAKRITVMKRALVLLAMGGATFSFVGLPAIGGWDSGCVRNADLVSFYQGVGDASVEAFRDSTANIIGSDFDAVVLRPAANFITALWDNQVDRSFPLDPGVNTVWRE